MGIAITAGSAGNATTGGIGGTVSIDGGVSGGSNTNGPIHLGLSSGDIEIGNSAGTQTVKVNGVLELPSLTVGGGATVSSFLSTTSSSVDPPALAPSQSWYHDLYVPVANFGD